MGDIEVEELFYSTSFTISLDRKSFRKGVRTISSDLLSYLSHQGFMTVTLKSLITGVQSTEIDTSRQKDSGRSGGWEKLKKEIEKKLENYDFLSNIYLAEMEDRVDEDDLTLIIAGSTAYRESRLYGKKLRMSSSRWHFPSIEVAVNYPDHQEGTYEFTVCPTATCWEYNDNSQVLFITVTLYWLIGKNGPSNVSYLANFFGRLGWDDIRVVKDCSYLSIEGGTVINLKYLRESFCTFFERFVDSQGQEQHSTVMNFIGKTVVKSYTINGISVDSQRIGPFTDFLSLRNNEEITGNLKNYVFLLQGLTSAIRGDYEFPPKSNDPIRVASRLGQLQIAAEYDFSVFLDAADRRIIFLSNVPDEFPYRSPLTSFVTNALECEILSATFAVLYWYNERIMAQVASRGGLIEVMDLGNEQMRLLSLLFSPETSEGFLRESITEMQKRLNMNHIRQTVRQEIETVLAQEMTKRQDISNQTVRRLTAYLIPVTAISGFISFFAGLSLETRLFFYGAISMVLANLAVLMFSFSSLRGGNPLHYLLRRKR